jgi:hypothetical protein
MEVRFATNHAEDIMEVLATQTPDENNQDQLAKLNDNFNKEINTLRTRIVALHNNKKVEVMEEDIATSTMAKTEEDSLITATAEKDDVGVQLNVNTVADLEPVVADVATSAATVTPVKLSSEPEVMEDEIPTTEVKGAEEILDEAQDLFDNKEYHSALDKLKEVKELMK